MHHAVGILVLLLQDIEQVIHCPVVNKEQPGLPCLPCCCPLLQALALQQLCSSSSSSSVDSRVWVGTGNRGEVASETAQLLM
jgi:hypothetical protein